MQQLRVHFLDGAEKQLYSSTQLLGRFSRDYKIHFTYPQFHVPAGFLKENIESENWH